MADALFLLIIVAFFGLMVLLVKACDHVIGSDKAVSAAEPAAVTGDGADTEPSDQPVAS